MFKLTDVPKSGNAYDGTAAGKRQTSGSGGAGAAWVMGTKFWGWYSFVAAVDELILAQILLRFCGGNELCSRRKGSQTDIIRHGVIGV